MSSDQILISGIEIDFSILRGRNLVAKDRNIFNKKTTSDPYVNLYIDDKLMGKTRTVFKNLNPVWDQSFKFNFSTDESNRMFTKFKNGQSPKFKLHMFDHDDIADDDDMGTVQGNLSLTEAPSARWLKVEISAGKSKPVTGDIQIKTAVSVRKLLTAVRGNSLNLSGETIDVLLNWKLEGGSVTDLDTSCVAVGHHGNIMMNETVYFGDLENSNRSIRHSGDAQAGGGKGERITCELSRVARHVKALYFILTVATPDKSFLNVKSASVSVVNTATKCSLCKFTPALVGDNTAMFLMRVMRKDTGLGWTMTMIEDTDHTARDFGTLIPEIKGYCRDFCPSIQVNPQERIAIMRKGGAVRLSDYSSPNKPTPDKVTFGLAWDVTNGRNVDLDASAICLNSSLQVVDIVSYQKLMSKDMAIQHGGDEREGDEVGDDEKIHLFLSTLDPSVAHVAFVITSYSGQELDDVSKASCHLFDSSTRQDIASYMLSNNSSLDKHTGLVMASLYKGIDGAWCMRIIAEAAQGRVAKDLVDEVQAFLRRNPPPKVQEVPEPEIIVNQMPEDVEIAVEPFVPMNDLANNVFVPGVPGTANVSNGPFVPPAPTPSVPTPFVPTSSVPTPAQSGGESQASGGVFVPSYGS